MTVTELTQFRLLAPSAFLTSKELGYGMKVLRDTTGHTCHLLLSGTSDIFLLESWGEVSVHEQFQKTAEHEAIMKIIKGQLEVLSISHMDMDIRGTSLMQQDWRGDVLLCETTGDVHTLVEENRVSAKVIGEEKGYLIDWSKEQLHAKALAEEGGDVWFRTAKVLDI